MARTIRNAKTDTRSARSKLAARREPYWIVVSKGCALGYRRGAKGGTWVARFRDQDGQQHYESLGAADDARDADGLTVFSFDQAQAAARTFFTTTARKVAGLLRDHNGPFTVEMALHDYFDHRAGRGSKGLRADQYAADARIKPELGTVEAAKLTTRRIRDWHAAIATAPKIVRAKAFAGKKATKAVDLTDPDAVRARKATANRVLTVLKAALNHAFHEGNIPSDDAWRKVKPFREADSAVVRYLSDKECVRLVNACENSFRDIVRGALLTGCRYGELTRLRVSDFNAEAGTLAVRLSKAGKPRHIALNAEGVKHFSQMAVGRSTRELLFLRSDKTQWKASHQQRPILEASQAAKVDPPATFHVLRHTYASSLAMRGVPMAVIAEQLGHADTRVTTKHYAHLSPSYVADTIRASLPTLGIVPDDANVAPIRKSA